MSTSANRAKLARDTVAVTQSRGSVSDCHPAGLPLGLRSLLRLGSSQQAMVTAGALALAAGAGLVITTPAHAQASTTAEVGDTLQDPRTGDPLRVIAVRDGAVLVEGYRLVLTDPRVGASVPDPADASQSVEIAEVTRNAETGLVEAVTLTDGRTLAVVRDVRDQVFAQSSANPLADFAPLPEPIASSNTTSLPFNGSRGADGDQIPFNDIPPDGSSGTAMSPVTVTVGGSRQSVFGSAVFVSGVGGAGGDGANGVVVVGGAGDGGSGGSGTALTVNQTGLASVGAGGLFGVSVLSQGGTGGDGGDGAVTIVSNGGDGARGGSGGSITLNNQSSANITTYGANSFGIYARSRGGPGGDGGDGGVGVDSNAGAAGRAGNGGSVSIKNFGRVHTFGASAHGLLGQSQGGSGGAGGDAIGIISDSSGGAAGGSGGRVVLENEAMGFIYTGGDDAHGILAQSIGGSGGASGTSAGLVALGDGGGSGREGGQVTVRNLSGGVIATQGDRGFGLLAQSVGGGGGSAGLSAGLVAIGGSGGSGGVGQTAVALNEGLIATSGDGAHGAVAQSIGGGGGTGSRTLGVLALGGQGSSGGNAGRAAVSNIGTIDTSGDGAHGALVQSIGGGGGNAGIVGGALAIGGRGGGGGSASPATFLNEGLVRTSGDGALGVLAQSIGGGGGNGSNSIGLLSIGGPGSAAGFGGNVIVTQGGAILTEGQLSHGIVAQSIGGGGGSGGFAGSASAFVGVAVGRTGGSGGNSGKVDIDFATFDRTIDGVTETLMPLIQTKGDLSLGVIAQSVGGGGGNGGAAVQVTGGVLGAVSVGVGGDGGGGGTGGLVEIEGDTIILTDGLLSHGILAQSVGGGGGNGGGAVAVSLAGGPVAGSVAVGVGGSGGAGGDGGDLNLNFGGLIATSGDLSHGLIAQSVGGGGGNGGFSVTVAGAAAAGPAVAIPVGVGGSGSAGGRGGSTFAMFGGDILTQGFASHAALVQSVGGGGGNGGFSIAAGVTGSPAASGSIAVGVGGIGGTGGNGGTASSSFGGGDVVTTGMFSKGIITQSVGGSGGNGGYNVSGALGLSSGAAGGVAVGVGGTGGGGGSGRTVNSRFLGDLLTTGAFGDGIVSQSVGGGGGNGGVNVSGTITASAAGAIGVSVGVGGAGGGAGNGGLVNAEVVGELETRGDDATAYLAQSVGGGGGNGGVNVSGSLTGSASGAGAIAVGIGGSGGSGGAGGTVEAAMKGFILTSGDNSNGLVAQSLGGGGGNGAVNVSAGITASATGSGNIAVGFGGAGGSASAGGNASGIVSGNVTTRGNNSDAVLVQSLGGGGGNGGINVGASLNIATNGGAGSIGFGGRGGGGGAGGEASLTISRATSVFTQGDESGAVVAQSLGGGGGNGGINISAGVNGTSGAGAALSLGFGGSGGDASRGGLVTLTHAGEAFTNGKDSTVIIAQSIGGGGGNGGINVTGAVSLASGTTGAVGVGFGGTGGGGGAGGRVEATVDGDASATGDGSRAIFIQSLGGGGGSGGINVTGGLAASSGTSGALSLAFGGSGGGGGSGGVVQATLNGVANAAGDGAEAVLVQSVGGGGGAGGITVGTSASFSSGTTLNGSLGLGGSGGSGGSGGQVTLTRISDQATTSTGANSDALVVQSVGGGGGNGGITINGALSYSASTSIAAAIGIGGSGGNGGRGGNVTATIEGDVIASGFARDGVIDIEEDGFLFFDQTVQRQIIEGGSTGVIAQSVGGGGGNGGLLITGGIGVSSGTGGQLIGIGLGASGGDGGAGGNVSLSATANNISGVGDFESALIAQSVGGGGGAGGVTIAGGIATNGTVALGIGGSGGSGSTGGRVDASGEGVLQVRGANSVAFLAQSIGGGGGNGGVTITGGINGSSQASIPSVSLGFGGAGGDGNSGGEVAAVQIGTAVATGSGATGVMAQSIGGGGGNGGFNLSGNLSRGRQVNIAAIFGGAGGNGNLGGVVTLSSDGMIFADGSGIADNAGDDSAKGVVAQSIGGGGGNGGVNASVAISEQNNPITFGLGANGGSGGAASTVTLNRGQQSANTITVFGDNATGLLAQSIGGGGGDAGLNLLGNLGLRAKADLQFAIGGAGGEGASGGAVTVNHTGNITAEGENVRGLVAQSIGGGGGNARSNILLGITDDGSDGTSKQADRSGTIATDISIGGLTGDGSDGGAVTVNHAGNLTTSGTNATALFAQSIGGGGGDAASSISNNFERRIATSIVFGREGGTGGIGGAVDVTASGVITASGTASRGIFAQSVGGGGGNSETSSISLEGAKRAKNGDETSTNLELSLGRTGGTGGDSGLVAVTTSAQVTTSGERAHAVFAQSVGGGGGTGGSAVIDLTQETVSNIVDSFTGDEAEQNEVTGYSLAVQIGGAGGSGAQGGAVSLENAGLAMTTGDLSNALRAQSIGGGGGDGGAVFNIIHADDDNSYALDVGIGGVGGTGSSAGAVTLLNRGIAMTSGREASALFAQSVGGGGGSASVVGSVSSAQIDKGDQSYTVALNLGGGGGTGGTGGAVVVENTGMFDEEGVLVTPASILTTGDDSHGILAQSIGGGGGNGSTVLSGSFGNTSSVYQGAVNVGGVGGTGGIAGRVDVLNTAVISTEGANAVGILAQSIGGGGGNGGLAIGLGNLFFRGTLDESGARQAILSLGGSGGSGNDAARVFVDNSGTIITNGTAAHGIQAQSLGGGGGNFGIGLSGSVDRTATIISTVVGLVLGGRGGEGGLGGEVEVNHTGAIEVSGEGAVAILAESINGGGGGLAIDLNDLAGFVAGDVLNIPVIEAFIPIPNPDDPEIPVIAILSGGAGGGSQNAEKVTVRGDGSIIARGTNAAGFFSQSVGGGGGTSRAQLGFADRAVTGGSSIDVEAVLGASDSTEVSGGDIDSEHNGFAGTAARNAPAVLLQTVGGGGGRTSMSLTGSETTIGAIDLALGGKNLATAIGGQIAHTQSGDVMTMGDQSVALLAQSIGGGGGLLSVSYSPDEIAADAPESGVQTGQSLSTVTLNNATIALGGAGGEALDGGAVNLTLSGSTIAMGDSAPAIVLQSIGGGGGTANVGDAIDPAVTLGGTLGATGNGGSITLVNDGEIAALGDNASAVLLQSIGGGGGAVFSSVLSRDVTLSAENSGNGGSIVFTQTGNVSAASDGAVAISVQSLGGGGGFVEDRFAGSAGGAGQGGSITVTIADGSVTADGAGATAVLLQSLGRDGGADITLSLAEGRLVRAGEGGTAVRFDGGASNTLVNAGGISTLSGLGGLAIAASSGNDAVLNTGMIIGNIALGGGTNSLSNEEGGVVLTSQMLDLGASSNLFTNAGLLLPGGTDAIQVTSLLGGFAQTQTGMTFAEANLANNSFDSIAATGVVDVSGSVDLTLLNIFDFTPGTLSVDLFSGAQGATAGDIDLRADSSVVLNLLGVSDTGNTVSIEYDLTFAPDEAIGNRARVGEYLDQVQTEGTPEALGSLFQTLILEQDIATYVDALTQLSGEFYAEQNAQALLQAENFAAKMRSCGTIGDHRVGEGKDRCAWASLNYRDRGLGSQAGMASVDTDGFDFALGGRLALGNGFSATVSAGYGDFDMIGFNGRNTASVEAIQFGAGGAYTFGNTTIGAYASFSDFGFDTRRQIAINGLGIAALNRSLSAVTGEIGVSHVFELGKFVVTPRVAVGLTSISRGGQNETGAGAAALQLDSTSENFIWGASSIELSYSTAINSRWSLRPFASAELRQSLESKDFEVMARFAGAGTSGAPMLSVVPLPGSLFEAHGGFEFARDGGFSIGASFGYENGGDRDGQSVALRVSLPF